MANSSAGSSASPGSNSRRFLAVLCVKNEAAFLLEWLAHHRAAGFTDFLVFSNDCADGTDAMLDRLQAMGWLTHLRNEGPYHDRGIQFTALKAAQKHKVLRDADWILPLDIDEFVTVKTGNHTVGDLVDALPKATAITLTWRLFGNAGVKRYEDAPITQIFTHCAPEVIHWPWRAVMFKTLYKNDGTYRALGVHRPRSERQNRLANAHWYDCEGRALSDDFKTRRIFSNYGQPNYALAQLNHYPLGAMESYVLKADRGRAVHGDDQLGLDYWVERNFNMNEDHSIAELKQKTDALRQGLLADPELNKRHTEAVAWRHIRFDRLMREDRFRALYGRLLMAPPAKLVTVQDARIMVNYALRGDDSDRSPS